MAKRLYSYTDHICISLKIKTRKIETDDKSTFWCVKMYRVETVF